MLHVIEKNPINYRDTLAAQALTAMIKISPLETQDQIDMLAIKAYQIADAMLRAREVV